MILKAENYSDFESLVGLRSLGFVRGLRNTSDPFLTLQLRCCGAEGPEDWARSVFNGFRDIDHAPEIGIPRTQADVVGGMALTAALPKVTMIKFISR